jgi:serine protease Do
MTVGELKPGDRAKFTVIRDGAAQDIQVRIEARTNEVASDNKKLWPGVFLVPLTDEMKESLKLDKNAKGLYVAQVLADSPANIIGLREGDMVISLNGEAIKDLPSYFKLLREKTRSELWFGFTRGDSALETLKYKR